MNKKLIIGLLLLSGSLVACSEGGAEGEAEDATEAVPTEVQSEREPVYEDTAGDASGQAPLRHTGTVEGDTVVMPGGTGDNI